MRLGMIAALIFIVLSLGIFYSAYTGDSSVDANTETALEELQAARLVAQEGDFGAGSYVTVVAAQLGYFSALIEGLAYQAYNNPIWDSGGWTIVPYFTISPFVAVIVFGLIILLIGLIQKQI